MLIISSEWSHFFCIPHLSKLRNKTERQD